MRVLVLGATGRLGSMLRWAWGRPGAGLEPTWQSRGQAHEGWARCDILDDPAGLTALCARADVIVTLAGVTPASGADMGLNTDLALAVQRAADGRPHLLASSAAVYGRAGGLCRESDAVTPAAPYGVAKHAMEQAVLAAGGPVTCLRIGNVAGADAILGQVGQGAALVLDQFPDGRTPRRSYIGPTTLAGVLAGLAHAAGQGRTLPEILNVAAPGTVEMGALLEAAGHLWTPRAAPATAIAEVALDIAALNRFTRPDPASGTAPVLVAEWRAFQEAARP
ncbi:NAD-dependent epimerase/dehydratase family protein [Alterinioella nitratireducens]|uniref:NAD-dependent epimerase/dehydratase family protein n=1 Tax=Alterinioella nitratireducens TaxID=2735915 RepID=UPI00155437F1|nr:NAD(P)-dependent oxidoreductase [Alterinioella nitratireducens]NPD21308.1 NAD(P)-dependent oxidoreductase [Alterinioella nitratireducens]